jgi:hypothetical protein
VTKDAQITASMVVNEVYTSATKLFGATTIAAGTRHEMENTNVKSRSKLANITYSLRLCNTWKD